MVAASFVDVTIDGAPVDTSLVALPVSITHGRSESDSQPDAPTLEFTYIGATQPGHVGDPITVQANNPGRWSDNRILWADPGWSWTGAPSSVNPVDRFVGTISTVEAAEVYGDVDTWTVQAVGVMSRLGFIRVDLSQPTETDSDRVVAIGTAAGVTVNVAGDPSLTLAADTIYQSALGALHQVCESSGGLLWQARDGSIWYGTANHRNRATEWVLPAGAILDGIEWAKEQEQIINSVTVEWGNPPVADNVSGTWNYKTGDTTADPGTGNINIEAGASIAFSRTSTDGVDFAFALRNLVDGTGIYGQEKDNSDAFQRCVIAGPVQDNGSWFRMNIRLIEGQGSLSNNADVSYRLGADSTESETYTDDASITQWGLRAVEVTTLCADEAQAGLLALTILARHAQPYWATPGVMVPYSDLNSSEVDTMQGLDVSVGILAPVPTTPGSTPAPLAQWAVEGYVEEWREDGYWAQLALTDWARSSSAVIRTYQTVWDDFTYGQAAATTYQLLLAEVI